MGCLHLAFKESGSINYILGSAWESCIQLYFLGSVWESCIHLNFLGFSLGKLHTPQFFGFSLGKLHPPLFFKWIWKIFKKGRCSLHKKFRVLLNQLVYSDFLHLYIISQIFPVMNLSAHIQSEFTLQNINKGNLYKSTFDWQKVVQEL